MDKLVIEGGYSLKGTVAVSGAKNAALPILAATLLTDQKCIIRNVPDLRDVSTMMKILGELGVQATWKEPGVVETELVDPSPCTAAYELVRQMRASFCVLGPLLAKRGRAKVSHPGGCVIGPRPVDLHLKGLRALGAKIEVEGGYVQAESPALRGQAIYLGGAYGSTVLGTCNVVMAAVLAKGTTILEAAACEPEVADLCDCLNHMGARITGIGTPKLEIEGVEELGGVDYKIIPDRIEAGTLMIAAAITHGDVILEWARLVHLRAVVDKLREVGVVATAWNGGIRVVDANRSKATDFATLPFPGIPTDMQAQLIALLATAEGLSVVTEKVFPDRFMHIAELNRMGAHIRREGPTAIIEGVPALSGAPVMASDLRASAALVIAGLAARGQTEVDRAYHLDRGYEHIEEKLSRLGARIWRRSE